MSAIGAFLNAMNCRTRLRGYSVVLLCSFHQRERIEYFTKIVCPFIENAFYYANDKKDGRGKDCLSLNIYSSQR